MNTEAGIKPGPKMEDESNMATVKETLHEYRKDLDVDALDPIATEFFRQKDYMDLNADNAATFFIACMALAPLTASKILETGISQEAHADAAWRLGSAVVDNQHELWSNSVMPVPDEDTINRVKQSFTGYVLTMIDRLSQGSEKGPVTDHD